VVSVSQGDGGVADIAGGSEHYLDSRVLEVVQDGEDRLELGDAFALAAEWVIRSSMLLTPAWAYCNASSAAALIP